MSRVASNHTTSPYTNGFSPSNKSIMSRSSSNASSLNHVVGGRPVTVRSAAPPPSQKETVHACPLCSSEYKDPRVLPCTHTYCFNCIRDKLIKNDRVTCPKCHHEVSARAPEHGRDNNEKISSGCVVRAVQNLLLGDLQQRDKNTCVTA